MRNHDLEAFMAQLAPDYHEQRTLAGKFRSRKDVALTYRKAMQHWNNIHDQKLDIYRISTRGNSAIVIVERSLVADVDDNKLVSDAKGNVHHVVLTTMEGDTWVKTSGHWLLQMRSITAIEMIVDGEYSRTGAFDDDHDH